MYCTKCGTENEEGISFCSNCGASLDASSSSKEREISKEKDKKGKRSSQRILVILLAVAVAIVLFICCVVPSITYRWASSPREEKTYEQLVYERVTLLQDGSVEACIRNALSGDAWIDTVYKNGQVVASEVNQKIPGNDVICFTLPGTYTAGDDILLISTEGTRIKLKVRG